MFRHIRGQSKIDKSQLLHEQSQYITSFSHNNFFIYNFKTNTCTAKVNRNNLNMQLIAKSYSPVLHTLMMPFFILLQFILVLSLFSSTYLGQTGPHRAYLQFKQHPLVKGLCPPLNLPVTYEKHECTYMYIKQYGTSFIIHLKILSLFPLSVAYGENAK